MMFSKIITLSLNPALDVTLWTETLMPDSDNIVQDERYDAAGKAVNVTRTLRYYDELGLLRPRRVTDAGYRVYGAAEVDRMQQILLYRAMGVGLSAIAQILDAPDFDRRAALRRHLAALEERQRGMALLIQTVRQTLREEEGEIAMSDLEKFEGLKESWLRENEDAYGKEARAAYGDGPVNETAALLRGMSAERFAAMRALEKELLAGLEAAVLAGKLPEGEEARALAAKHREWLAYSWGTVAPAAHWGLADIYVRDARFTACYDRSVPGCARFLRDAVHAWYEMKESGRGGG